MIPGNQLSGPDLHAEFLEPRRDRRYPLVDTEFGGAGLSNPSAGLRVQLWTLRVEGDDVIVSAPSAPSTVLFSRAGIVDVGLAFDRNMSPFVAFEDAGGVAYWHYGAGGEPVISPYLPAGSTNPRCTMDDKREAQSATSDIVLAYLRDSNLYFRQQREEFAVEHLLKEGAGSYLLNIGMNRRNRMQFRLSP